MTEHRPNNVLHVRPAEPKGDPLAPGRPTALVVGNRSALEALRGQLAAALENGNSHRVYLEADGARFEVAVRVAGSVEEMGPPAELEGA